MLEETFSVCMNKDKCSRKDCLRNYTPAERVYTAVLFGTDEKYEKCEGYIKPLTFDDLKNF